MPESPKIRHVILLTGNTGAKELTTFLQLHAPRLDIVHVATRIRLDALPANLLTAARLIGFGTSIVVPARILRRLGYGAYNFHPGSPDYPGWAPASFAIYERAPTFGATAHEMIDKVDAGPIVGTSLFPVPSGFTVYQLEREALTSMLELFRRLAPFLARDPKPLPALPVAWRQPARTRAEFCRMAECPADLDEEERRRRRLAFTDASRSNAVARGAA